MSKKIEIDPNKLANLSRRVVLGSSMGLGAIAAAKLLGAGKLLAKDASPAGQSGPDMGKLTTGHFAGRAKRAAGDSPREREPGPISPRTASSEMGPGSACAGLRPRAAVRDDRRGLNMSETGSNCALLT